MPGLEGDTVSGIVAPAGTPQPIIARLNAEIQKAAATPDVSAKLAALGFGAVASDPDEFGARILVEITKWAKVINEAKIKIDCVVEGRMAPAIAAFEPQPPTGA